MLSMSWNQPRGMYSASPGDSEAARQARLCPAIWPRSPSPPSRWIGVRLPAEANQTAVTALRSGPCHQTQSGCERPGAPGWLDIKAVSEQRDLRKHARRRYRTGERRTHPRTPGPKPEGGHRSRHPLWPAATSTLPRVTRTRAPGPVADRRGAELVPPDKRAWRAARRARTRIRRRNSWPCSSITSSSSLPMGRRSTSRPGCRWCGAQPEEGGGPHCGRMATDSAESVTSSLTLLAATGVREIWNVIRR